MPNVQVAIRCRPKLDHESGIPSTKIEVNEHSNTIAVLSQNNAKTFKFDKVFSEAASQQDVFDYVAPMVDNVLSGLHATVFAYGQTGSGKTFTMDGFNYAPATTNARTGEPSAPKPRADTPAYQHGVVPRIIQLLFDRARERMGGDTADEADAAEGGGGDGAADGIGSTMRFKLKCSFMQLYNEKISDLLNPTSTKNSKEGLKIRWTRSDQFAVENLYVFECDSPDQMREMFMAGIKEKVMGSHHMNLQSSRSHSLFTIHVHGWDSSTPDLVRKSELTLVDLAGSEKLHLLSQNPSQQLLKESIEINTSLLALGKVITALATNSKQHVPYRDSKLTKLLKHALGGNSVTTMIACCNPLDPYVEETVSTLLYASRARNITNDPRVNENPQSALIRQLREEISSLKMELEYYRQLVATGVVDDGLAKRLANRLDRTDQQQQQQISPAKQPLGITDGGKRKGGDDDSPPPRGDASSGALVPGGEGSGSRSEVEVELAEKLLESCNILKSLMGVNAQLRTAFDRLKTAKETVDKRELAVNAENTALRERIEMLESIAMGGGGGKRKKKKSEGSSSVGDGNSSAGEEEDDDDDEDNSDDSGRGSDEDEASSAGRLQQPFNAAAAQRAAANRAAATIKAAAKPKRRAGAQPAQRRPGPYAQKLQDYANKYRNPTRSVAYEDYYGRAAPPAGRSFAATGGGGNGGVGRPGGGVNGGGGIYANAPASAYQHTQRFDLGGGAASLNTDAEERKSRELGALLDQLTSKLPRQAMDMVPKSLMGGGGGGGGPMGGGGGEAFGALSFGGAAGDVQQMEDRRRQRHERLARLQAQNEALMGAAPPPLVVNLDKVPNAHLMVMGNGGGGQQQHQNRAFQQQQQQFQASGGGGGSPNRRQQHHQQQPQSFSQLLGSSGGGGDTDRLLRPASSSSAAASARGGSNGGTLQQTNAERLFAYLSADEMQGAFTAEQLAKLRNRGGGGGGAGSVAPLSNDASVYGGGMNGSGSSRRGNPNSAPSTPSGQVGTSNSGRGRVGAGGTYSSAVPQPMSMAASSSSRGAAHQQQPKASTPNSRGSQQQQQLRGSGGGIGGAGDLAARLAQLERNMAPANNGSASLSTPRSKSSYDMGSSGGYSGDRGRGAPPPLMANPRPTVGSLGALGQVNALSLGGGSSSYGQQQQQSLYGASAPPSHIGGGGARQPQGQGQLFHEVMHRREQQASEQQRYQQQIYEAQQALLAQQQRLAQQRR